jgi:hypothetical protein
MNLITLDDKSKKKKVNNKKININRDFVKNGEISQDGLSLFHQQTTYIYELPEPSISSSTLFFQLL